MKRITSLLTLFLLCTPVLFSQEKKPMDHGIYESWKTLENAIISPNGNYVVYEVNPQQGDGLLCIYDTDSGDRDTIPRGYKAQFLIGTDYLAGLIKPPFQDTREAKKEKKKKDEMPRDSFFIFHLEKSSLEIVPDVRSFKTGEDQSTWFAYHLHYQKPEKDSLDKEDEDNALEKLASEKKLGDLVLINPAKERSLKFENIASYEISKKGRLIAFHQFAGDSLIRSVVYTFDTKEENSVIVFDEIGYVDKLTLNDTEDKLAFLHHTDSTANSGYSLNLWEINTGEPVVLVDSTGTGLGQRMGVSNFGKLYFSGQGDRLFFGRKEIPDEEPEDTLLESEKPSLDVWSYTDQILQPMQKERLKEEKEKTYLSYVNLKNGRIILLENEEVDQVQPMHEGDGDYMLGKDYGKYDTALSWEGVRYADVWLIDAKTGERKLILEKHFADVQLSAFGNYLVYYDPVSREWFSYETSGGNTVSLTGDIGVSFFNELEDRPTWPRPYGLAGFTQNDEHVLIRDRYDIWMIDPEGKSEPKTLTNSFGRQNQLRIRRIKLDKDDYYLKLEKDIYFYAFDEESKENGIGLIRPELRTQPQMLVYGKNHYSGLKKAEEEDLFIYRKADFRNYGDLYLGGPMLTEAAKISDVNPQSAHYLWGDVRLISWRSFNGEELQGMLYTPEDLDTSKSYPMLVYFYEKSSDRIYQHRIPSPSRSIISIPWCTSNGYVVFVPDITYREGFPGQSAYDAIVSGTQSVIERFPFIDKENIGIQGQSWGGYQVAWLVTRTNMFKAAMAGAPVSNMTSAYGGIRWGSGMSRMFQYERTQSRIGGTLWERQDLYIENSPLFRIPSVETPVLIMHNDKDGAVPWYQGIEMFVALRRLNKPAWMLTYNQEEHNLRKWPNRIDLSIRMMQFFDHYLKDEPMPDWMKYGVKQIDKGKKDGRSLLEKEAG